MRVSILLLAVFTLPGARSGPDSSPDLSKLYAQSISELRSGNVRAALATAQSGYSQASRQQNQKFRVGFLLMLGNGYSVSMQYRPALKALTEASEIATKVPNMQEFASSAASIMSSIYARQGQQDLALQQAELGLKTMPPKATPASRALALLALADIRQGLPDRRDAARLYALALDTAALDPNPSAYADVCNELGFTLLDDGKLPEAESALTEAFRIRLLNRLPGLDSSYRNLGSLRLKQGDARSANVLYDRAVELQQAGRSRFPGWIIYYRRALARQASGNLIGALADLQRSIDDARLWRADILPLDQVQDSGDVYLAAVYSQFVRTAMQLSKLRRDPSLVERAFLAAEESRAGALRQSRSWRQNLPPVYWEVLAESRRAEIAALANPSDAAPADRLKHLRAELASTEAKLGSNSQENSERNTPRQALSVFRHCLHLGEALVSFHLGEKESFAWALTSTSLEVARLPPRSELSDQVAAFRSEVLSGKSGEPVSSALYQALFGPFSRTLRRYPDWILTLDDALFEAPLAALRTPDGFLIERHSLRVVPSAHLLDGGRAAASPVGFVGIGDPIYNAADPRWRSLSRPVLTPVREGLGRSAQAELLQLPRLPGGGAEIAAAAGVWKNGPARLLTGAAVNRARVTRELRGQRSVFHFAVHVLQARDAPEQSYLALGLDSSGRPDFLTVDEIAALRCDGPLIVLSACNSGQGKALPGAGQLGLTRAWLLGGARAVAASHWPTPDEEGSLFRVFYRELGRRLEPISARASARALRRAQAEMIGSHSWRSDARYWAAFFIVGRD